jgi:hypothetical protein
MYAKLLDFYGIGMAQNRIAYYFINDSGKHEAFACDVKMNLKDDEGYMLMGVVFGVHYSMTIRNKLIGVYRANCGLAI